MENDMAEKDGDCHLSGVFMKKKESSTLLTCLMLIILSLTLIATGCPLQPSPTSNPCRVVFQTGEGQGTAPYPQIVVEGHIIELPGQETMTHPSGKILSKWRSDDGTTYNPYYRYTVTRNVEFTAQWIASTSIFTVTFNPNNGIGTPPESKSVQAGSNITLPNEGGLSRSGYTFGGWNTDASGTGNNYRAGTTYMPISDITLYAKWDANSTNTPGGSGTTPIVTSVTVTPVTASVVKGKTQSFGATVNGTNNPAQTVTWSILNTNKNSETTITNGGYLTVSASESLTTLTVRATSTADTTKFGEATVNVFALAAPTGVKAVTRSTSSIYIEWLPVAGAATYDVYYDIVGVSSVKQKVSVRRDPSTLFHAHASLQNNTTYRYYIKAINSSGGESDYSDPSNDATTGRY